MTGLKDIAAEAGVSVRTVSRVLTGSGYAKQATREKVQAAARRLGYRANRHARSLRTARSYEVAVAAWSTDELYMAKVAAFERTLRGSDYAVTMLFGQSAGSGSAGELMDELITRRPAGVALFTPPDRSTVDCARRLAQAGTPYVVFDSSDDVDAIRIDRQQGVYEAVLYLAATGRQRIAYLGTRKDTSRLQGYQRAMDQLGREPILLDYAHNHDGIRDLRLTGRRVAERFDRPDAVQAYSDEVAMGFLAGLHEAGLTVPDDLALVGFDDRLAASWAAPPLTTVAQPNEQVGQAAADMLLRKIANERRPPDGWSRVLPTRLVVRETT
jgi:LacI family transcriptional regulator